MIEKLTLSTVNWKYIVRRCSVQEAEANKNSFLNYTPLIDVDKTRNEF